MVNDITERLKIERELADTKVLLQSALGANARSMVLISAPGGIVRVINSACFESLGAEAEPSPTGHPIDTLDQIKWPDFESEGNRYLGGITVGTRPSRDNDEDREIVAGAQKWHTALEDGQCRADLQ